MKQPANEDRQLQRIAGDLRLVGFVLAILGAIVCLAAAAPRGGGFGAQAIGIAGVSILVLPGAWFVAAASLVGGGRGARVVAWSLRIVAVQLASCAAAVVGLWQLVGRAGDGLLVLPVALLAFFAPAQGVLVWQLFRARRLIDARDARRGFAATTAVRVADVVALPADVDAPSIPIAQAREESR